MYAESLGWFGVCMSVLFWGTWASFLKAKSMSKVAMDPLVLQVYLCLAIFLVGIIVAFAVGFVWTPWAIVGSLIWVPTNTVVVFAVRVLGLGVASGVCSGNIILSSFVWGAAATSLWHDPACVMANPGLATLGLAILIASVAGLAVYGSPESAQPGVDSQPQSVKPSIAKEEVAHIASSIASETVNTETLVSDVPREGSPHSSVAADSSSVSGTVVIAVEHDLGKAAPEKAEALETPSTPQIPSSKAFVLGLAATAVAGIVGGSIVVPLKMAELDGVQGMRYVPAFSLCVLLLAVLQLCASRLITGNPVQWHVQEALRPGLLSGTFWSIGNIGSVYASLSPLGQTTGFPLTQGAVLVAGVLAIVLFKEVKGRRRVISFLACGVTLMIGAAVLAQNGQCIAAAVPTTV